MHVQCAGFPLPPLFDVDCGARKPTRWVNQANNQKRLPGSMIDSGATEMLERLNKKKKKNHKVPIVSNGAQNHNPATVMAECCPAWTSSSLHLWGPVWWCQPSFPPFFSPLLIFSTTFSLLTSHTAVLPPPRYQSSYFKHGALIAACPAPPRLASFLLTLPPFTAPASTTALDNHGQNLQEISRSIYGAWIWAEELINNKSRFLLAVSCWGQDCVIANRRTKLPLLTYFYAIPRLPLLCVGRRTTNITLHALVTWK